MTPATSPQPLIPAADPRSGYLAYREEIDAAIGRVLERGRYILGEEVVAFEREFAEYLGVRSAVGVGSGTDALVLALRACGIGSGDAVVAVSHTAVATVAAIELTGASPLLVDIDPETFTLDPSRLAATVQGRVGTAGARIKAVIVVHLYGQPADMPTILGIAERHGLYVIEDCAQAHGARLDGRRVGGWGHVAAFSFYPTKNLGAVGDGGAVVTDDTALADRVRLLREYGWRQRYISDIPGTNSRLDELQAAVLRVKLRHLDADNASRRQIAAVYDTTLSSAPLRLPRPRAGVEHVYHQYVVRADRRDNLRDFLAAEGVGTLVHYPMPVHLQPAYRSRVPVGDGGLPHTELVCREILSLPIGPHMDEASVQSVARRMCRWLERAGA